MKTASVKARGASKKKDILNAQNPVTNAVLRLERRV